MKKNIIEEKSFSFAVEIVNLYKCICEDRKGVCFIETITEERYKYWCQCTGSIKCSKQERFFVQNEYCLKRNQRNQILAGTIISN